MHHSSAFLVLVGQLLFTTVSSSPIANSATARPSTQKLGIVPSAAHPPGHSSRSPSTAAYTRIDIPELDSTPNVSIKADDTEYMSIVVCTDSPIFYGNCLTIQLEKTQCVDMGSGPWDDTISSIEVDTMNTLCMIYTDHDCTGGSAMWLNMGDTSRDTVDITPYNDQISSIACYWDLRGVTGTWNSN